MKTSQVIKLKPEVVAQLNSQLEEEKAELAVHLRDKAAAAEQGDLKENSEYELASERVTISEFTIANLSKVLENVVIDTSVSDGKSIQTVDIMTELVLGRRNFSTGVEMPDEHIYIVIDALGDIGEVDDNGNQLSWDKISIDSSFGRVMMGKSVQDAITYGGIVYTIKEIREIDYTEFFQSK